MVRTVLSKCEVLRCYRDNAPWWQEFGGKLSKIIGSRNLSWFTALFTDFCIRFIAKFKRVKPVMSGICVNVHQ